ncbi:MAG: hypothetical protein A2289_07880 [Deltaproteobacteria bacterium RIFOXYA12_FULL_58_15]|nr:MAG: hypothetical protein A2289_07880 [Deltaproteobacteria bacterium RIFOXYA12_FULL_58_15]
MTRSNYLRLWESLRARGVLLVAMQYPRRPLSSLQLLFDDPSGIVFVDNEARFEDALRRMPYEQVFMDRCYGDFGHATEFGRRMLAQSVAEAMLGWLGGRGGSEAL